MASSNNIGTNLLLIGEHFDDSSKKETIPFNYASLLPYFIADASTDKLYCYNTQQSLRFVLRLSTIKPYLDDTNTPSSTATPTVVDAYTKEESNERFEPKGSFYTKTETDGKLDTKADKTDVYTKTETDTKLDTKADKTALDAKADKTALDTKADKTALDAKADKTDVYTKTETDTKLDTKADKTALDAKADKTDVYTKTETDGKLDKKADKTALDAKADKTDVYTKIETDLNFLKIRGIIEAKDGPRMVTDDKQLNTDFRPYDWSNLDEYNTKEKNGLYYISNFKQQGWGIFLCYKGLEEGYPPCIQYVFNSNSIYSRIENWKLSVFGDSSYDPNRDSVKEWEKWRNLATGDDSSETKITRFVVNTFGDIVSNTNANFPIISLVKQPSSAFIRTSAWNVHQQMTLDYSFKITNYTLPAGKKGLQLRSVYVNAYWRGGVSAQRLPSDSIYTFNVRFYFSGSRWRSGVFDMDNAIFDIYEI